MSFGGNAQPVLYSFVPHLNPMIGRQNKNQCATARTCFVVTIRWQRIIDSAVRATDNESSRQLGETMEETAVIQTVSTNQSLQQWP